MCFILCNIQFVYFTVPLLNSDAGSTGLRYAHMYTHVHWVLMSHFCCHYGNKNTDVQWNFWTEDAVNVVMECTHLIVFLERSGLRIFGAYKSAVCDMWRMFL